MRFLEHAAVVAISMCVASADASAQRVVVFGDSLSDSGNVNAITGGAAPGSPLGRFSNGYNWADLAFGTNPQLGFGLGGALTGAVNGYDNYAVGGALTGSGNITPIGIGVAQEIAAFGGAGGTFASRDLVTLWGGANNGFAALQSSGGNPNVIISGAGTAATAQVANVQSLIGLGARTILVFNIPDLGATPSVSSQGAAAVQGGNLFTTVYNGALANGLSQVAAGASGVNIIQGDIAAAFRVILANPAAFGFSNVTTPCGFNGGAACNGVLFGDDVHPTQAAYALVALYANLLLNTAPAIAQTRPLGEIGQWTTGLVTNSVFERLSNWVTGVYALKNGAYAEGIGQTGSYEEGSANSSRVSLGGVRAGYDYGFGNTLVGGSVAFLGGQQGANGFSNDILAIRGDIYGTLVLGQFYASVNGSTAHLTFDNIKRDTGFPTVVASASTNGFAASASGEVGFVQRFGGFAVIPSARATYIYSEVKGYKEIADILALQFNDRATDNVLGSARVRVVTETSLGALPAAIYGEVGYEGYLKREGGNITARLADNTALPVVVSAGNPNGQGVLGKVGLSSQLRDSLWIDLSYGISVHDQGGETHTADLRAKAHF